MSPPTNRTVTFTLEPNPNHQEHPPPSNLPLLILTSHSHSPPLHPPPSLKFDVRSLPNPPKNVRDAYDGTSKQLREWLIKSSSSGSGSENGMEFVQRMEGIREAILGRMREFEKEIGGGKQGTSVLKDENEEGGVLVTSCDEEVGSELKEKIEGKEEEREEDENKEEAREKEESEGVVLRVGIFCEMGRHRSVAMVEELARLKWSGWDVEVVHRDVERKKRKEGKQERRKHGRGTVFGGRVPE